MAEKKKIQAADIITDIRAGLTDKELMTKYHLSSKGLQSALTKLIKLLVIDPDEIESRFQLYDDTVNIHSMRRAVRVPAPYPVEIRDKKDLNNHGMVRDISELGVGVEGIKTKANDERSLVIMCDEIVDIDPIEFDAVCRWAKTVNDGTFSAGFEITHISDLARTELKKLIRNMSYMHI
jgi:hypothetical protein